MEDSLIFYQFSRSMVERGDFSHFLGAYSLDRLPTGRRLRTMMNSMVFCIGGYDHDPREIYKIPEVRRFYRQFHDAWPYWFYFCNLDTDTFRSVAFCCIDNITAVAYEGRPESLVHYDRSGVVQFMIHEPKLWCNEPDLRTRRHVRVVDLSAHEEAVRVF